MACCTPSKRLMRIDIRNKLRLLSDTEVMAASQTFFDRFVSTPEFSACRAISLFLSMNTEIQTRGIVEEAFLRQKRVFIPKCTESKMLMIELVSIEHLSRLEPIQFLKSVIYEPALSPTDDTDQLDQISLSAIDLVLTPGLAFSTDFSRLGQGKGHYGKYHYNSIDLTRQFYPSFAKNSRRCLHLWNWVRLSAFGN